MTINPLLWVIPALPLAGFIVNALFGPQLGKRVSGILATLAIWAAFACSLAIFSQVGTAPDHRIFSPAFEWIGVAGLKLELAADPLTSLMLLIITGVGALIHGYSMGYMSHEKNYSRYFTYLNLFVFFMLILVLGANLVLTFVGWEGVGLASYLLIGFYSEKKSATDAGKKAFIVNRVGDAAFLIALFALYWSYGSLDYFGTQGILTKAGTAAPSVLIPLLLFVGACGKSAQFPLHVWLPDAMEGPTPVSALIHAATMVTAGVFLVCRMSPLFVAAPAAMTVVAIIGLFTAIFAASIALTQNDIKKVLAYSTVSQLGFMFLACGVGAFTAAMFHVMTHAFFKALLFLGSGSVIHAMSGEQDMRKMGGLWKKLPITGWTMAIGTAAISGIPLLAGFWSKDEILLGAYHANIIYWVVAFITAGMTAFYMTRMMVKTFAGERRYDDHVASHLHESPLSMTLPLAVLAVLSVVGGFLNAEAFGIHALGHWLESALAAPAKSEEGGGLALGLMAASGVLGLVVCGFALFGYKNRASGDYVTEETRKNPLFQLVADKWRVDELYNDIFVTGGTDLAKDLRDKVDRRGTDGIVNGVVLLIRWFAERLKGLQSGLVRSYALTMLIGALLVAIGCVIGLSR
ncbi:MAG: NADH-quinone oxidoreductase subunit L [Armatimonas sp.]